MQSLLALIVLAAAPVVCQADESPAAPPESKWCPPDGPKLSNQLLAPQRFMLKPGWVTLRMHVRPGALPVSDVRVVSEAGGPTHARTWLPLVRQWIGCASNERETNFDMKFTFSYRGSEQLPEKEGFGPNAFREPRGAPRLPVGDWGIGVCPIKATLLLRQPDAPNVVEEVESQGGAPVRDWLEGLVPNRDYMTPSPKGNRIEFNCRVANGEVAFHER